MTPAKEVNSDKDDDVNSFFTVQNPTATVSVLEQLNATTSLGCSVILPVSTAVRTVCQTEYPTSSLAACE